MAVEVDDVHTFVHYQGEYLVPVRKKVQLQASVPDLSYCSKYSYNHRIVIDNFKKRLETSGNLASKFHVKLPGKEKQYFIACLMFTRSADICVDLFETESISSITTTSHPVSATVIDEKGDTIGSSSSQEGAISFPSKMFTKLRQNSTVTFLLDTRFGICRAEEPSLLASDMGAMFEAENFTDVTIECKTRLFKAHKVILAARSEVFKAMFTHDTQEAQEGKVTITDVEPSVVNSMLKYIYTGTLDRLTEEAAADLIIAADLYQLLDLKKKCEAVLGASLTVDNAVGHLIIGECYNAKSLMNQAIEFIVENRGSFQKDDWKNQLKNNPDALIALLSRLMNESSLESES